MWKDPKRKNLIQSLALSIKCTVGYWHYYSTESDVSYKTYQCLNRLCIAPDPKAVICTYCCGKGDPMPC